MDLFKYTASVKEIETCKTVGELEELVRFYYSRCPSVRHLVKPSPEQKHYYKLWTLALKKFESKTKRILPKFLTQDLSTLQTNLITSMLEAETETEKKIYYASPNFTKVPTYEEFMDWFEFDDTLNLHPSHKYVESLNSIIENKPVHFKVIFNYSTDQFDSYSTNLHQKHQDLVYAIRYKQVNFPDKPQTIWDMFIEDCVKESKFIEVTEEQVNSDVLKLEQQISALKALKGYLK